MVAFSIRSQRLEENRPTLVGVFEDDLWLLRLTESYRLAESKGSEASNQIDSNELVFADGRLVDSRAWDL